MDDNFKAFGMPETSVETTMIGLSGLVVDDADLALAKAATTKRGDQENTMYFVMTTRGNLYDPYNRDVLVSRGEINRLKLKKVKSEAYELYVKYLESKNNLHYSKAKRLIRG